VAIRCPLEDLSRYTPEERAERVRVRGEELVRTTFALAEPPLFRMELMRWDESRHTFLFVFQHMVLDGFQFAQFLEEIGKTYDGLLSGEGRPLPAPSLHYPDFAVWQEARLRAGVLAPHGAYWRRQLRAPLPAMLLPHDRPAPDRRSFEIDTLIHSLPPELVRSLRALRRTYLTTPFRTILAAFGAFLYRLTDDPDVLVAMMFSTRPAECGQVVGFFANALPLRMHLAIDRPFFELLARVNDQLKEAGLRKEFPLSEVFRSVKLERDPSRPILPVCISQFSTLDLAAGPLRMTSDYPFARGSTFDLDLVVWEKGDGVDLCLAYSTELFHESTIRRFLRSLETLLASAVANPQLPLSGLDLVPPEERTRLLIEFNRHEGNQPHSPPALARCAHQRFEDESARRPGAIAALCGAERVTYRELNDRANRIADRLRSQKVGREDRVGVFGHRGIGMLSAILGILKAGAAFVPLGPDQPDRRLRVMLRQARLAFIVTERGLAARSADLATAGGPGLRVFCWDESLIVEPDGRPSTEPTIHHPNNPDRVSDPGDLAYIIYTSGSTGTPKGAMVEHRGLTNHLHAKTALLGLNQDSVVVQNASHCFDISVWQLLAALTVGGRVVIYDEADARDPSALIPGLVHDEATVLEVVPSLLEELLTPESHARQLQQSRLSFLLSTGEALPAALCRRWLSRFPAIPLVNAYGPTECSDDVTHFVVERSLPGDSITVPVGRPIPGIAIYVLDERLCPVPIGHTGQIAVGGVGVGRGYLDDPVATARTYVPDPFASEPGSRLYLTGDRGRWSAGGVLEMIGRLDTQVKLRGYRIELGELESTLAQHPGVRQVTAIVHADRNGDERLVAYWVGDAALDRVALRAFVAERLPAYMVPDIFVALPAMPLTRNGKIDRRALPEPRSDSGDVEPGFVSPRDGVELALAQIWEEELGVSIVGVFDNFFDRGGHSLKAVSVVSRIRARLGVDLPLRALFEQPTIAGLGRVLSTHLSSVPREPSGGCVVPLQRGASESRPLFLVHPHGGTVFCYHALARALGTDQAVFGLQSRGLSDGEEALSTIEEMATLYVDAIRRVQPQGPYHVAGWSLGGRIAFELARQLEQARQEVGFLGIFDTVLENPDSWSDPEFTIDNSIAALARTFIEGQDARFEGLSEEQALDVFLELGQRQGILPLGLSRPVVSRLVRVIRANGLAFVRYRPSGRVNADIVLFRAAAKSFVQSPEAWAKWTGRRLHVVSVTGAHEKMMHPPCVCALADALKAHLSEAAVATVA
jgi:amino acid adenylation domain-containing protein